jgi:hypothetical protein
LKKKVFICLFAFRNAERFFGSGANLSGNFLREFSGSTKRGFKRAVFPVEISGFSHRLLRFFNEDKFFEILGNWESYWERILREN